MHIIEVDNFVLKIVAFLLCFILLVITVIFVVIIICENEYETSYQELWMSLWLNKLIECKYIEEIKNIQIGPMPATIIIRYFNDGSWATVVTTGRDNRFYNAAVLYDSNEHAYVLDPVECHILKVADLALRNIKVKSLSEFHNNSEHFKLKRYVHSDNTGWIFSHVCNCRWVHPLKKEKVEVKIIHPK